MTPAEIEQAREPDGSLIVNIVPDHPAHGKYFPAKGFTKLMNAVVKLLESTDRKMAGEARYDWLLSEISRDAETGQLSFRLTPSKSASPRKPARHHG
jgi:hypothetical protein